MESLELTVHTSKALRLESMKEFKPGDYILKKSGINDVLLIVLKQIRQNNFMGSIFCDGWVAYALVIRITETQLAVKVKTNGIIDRDLMPVRYTQPNYFI